MQNVVNDLTAQGGHSRKLVSSGVNRELRCVREILRSSKMISV